LQVLPNLRAQSVDLLLADLPYGVTNNKWDTPLDLPNLWQCLNRVCTEKAAMLFTATEPFTSTLVQSNREHFRYDLIWEKTIASGQLNVKTRPLRVHENVLVFYRKQPVYHEQLLPGTPYEVSRTGQYAPGSYRAQKPSRKTNSGFRHARSVLKVSNPRVKGGHPTQKPVPLLSWLIQTFSDQGDVVLDCCMGSGSTGVACQKTQRKFIGIENNARWFDVATKKLEMKDQTHHEESD
jgi:site-specific DNA-methyltransferase (adenine-specific)